MVKKLLKLVHIYRSYRQNKPGHCLRFELQLDHARVINVCMYVCMYVGGPFFWTTYVQQM